MLRFNSKIAISYVVRFGSLLRGISILNELGSGGYHGAWKKNRHYILLV